MTLARCWRRLGVSPLSLMDGLRRRTVDSLCLTASCEPVSVTSSAGSSGQHRTLLGTPCISCRRPILREGRARWSAPRRTRASLRERSAAPSPQLHHRPKAFRWADSRREYQAPMGAATRWAWLDPHGSHGCRRVSDAVNAGGHRLPRLVEVKVGDQVLLADVRRVHDADVALGQHRAGPTGSAG